MAPQVTYRDRQTGKMHSEPLYLPKVQYAIARSRIAMLFYNLLFNTFVACWLLGRWTDWAGSRKKIQKFVQEYTIDLDEVELPLDAYENLNAFFCRKLKKEARPFVTASDVFCSPVDGKVLVYGALDDQTRLPVKGAYVDIVALMASEEFARPYFGGAAMVIRLAPSDYHRYHFPVDGKATEAQEISGGYYLVNPIALDVKPDLFAHNKRMVTYLDTECFGRVMMMEVAGWAVGRMEQTYQPGLVTRGQEKGYFKFGGSTVVLLFEPGRIVFDNDLVSDTQAGIEVQVQTGTQLGMQAKL